MSDYETYSEWPKPLVPSFKADFMIDKDTEGYHLYIFNKSENDFMPFGPLVFNNNEKDQPGADDIVWRLPPSLATSKEDPELKAEMNAIGESNRMTLKFIKP